MPTSHFEVLFDQEDVLAINKPAGVALFADRQSEDSLWPDLQAQLGKILPVHRLDKGTSGVLLFARTAKTQGHLNRLFLKHDLLKFYVAECVGRLVLGSTHHIDLPLMPGRKSRYRVAGQRADIEQLNNTWHLKTPASTNPQSSFAALTSLRTLRIKEQSSELLLRPHSGRTHQLRVHLAWIGHPIRGDHLYGNPKAEEQQAPRLQLHCHCMSFRAESGKSTTIRAPLPSSLHTF